MLLDDGDLLAPVQGLSLLVLLLPRLVGSLLLKEDLLVDSGGTGLLGALLLLLFSRVLLLLGRSSTLLVLLGLGGFSLHPGNMSGSGSYLGSLSWDSFPGRSRLPGPGKEYGGAPGASRPSW